MKPEPPLEKPGSLDIPKLALRKRTKAEKSGEKRGGKVGNRGLADQRKDMTQQIAGQLDSRGRDSKRMST